MEKFIEKPRHIEVQILGEWGAFPGPQRKAAAEAPLLLAWGKLQGLSLRKTLPRKVGCGAMLVGPEEIGRAHV